MGNFKLRLKPVLLFWQEVFFLIVLGVLVIGMTLNISTSFQHAINIVFYCLFFLLLSGLVGQLFWRNRDLAIALSVVLGVGSGYMVLAILSDLIGGSVNVQTLLGLFLYFGLIVAAITMPFKYKNKI